MQFSTLISVKKGGAGIYFVLLTGKVGNSLPVIHRFQLSMIDLAEARARPDGKKFQDLGSFMRCQ